MPDRKRRGIEKILSKYDLQEYDEFKLLKRSGARLPIDTLEFIDPIFGEYDITINRIFYIEGVRHYFGCDGEDCDKTFNLDAGDKLKFELEPENEFDKYAIKIMDTKGDHVGFLPRYYSKSMTNLLKHGTSYNCTVLEVNKEHQCRECLKVELVVNADTVDTGGIEKIS